MLHNWIRNFTHLLYVSTAYYFYIDDYAIFCLIPYFIGIILTGSAFAKAFASTTEVFNVRIFKGQGMLSIKVSHEMEGKPIFRTTPTSKISSLKVDLDQ